ncbi:MAG: C4-dicarboxylate ABC transporter [Rubrivivax sp.]|nr:MAG: C4-dicarboxylate ABC transporter [Rubrivivax sp.]
MAATQPLRTAPRPRIRAARIAPGVAAEPAARSDGLIANLGPNWFASVMGTGIIANAAALLPVHAPALITFADGVWVIAAVWLLVLLTLTAAHWRRHPAVARGHVSDPAMAPFYGAPAMALLTVGAGALLVGHHLIGMPAALVIAFTLWTVGTIGGLLTSALVPYLLFTRHEVAVDTTFATWLMPIVPPMVSAATGAGLIAHLPAGQARELMLLACYAMFGLSLLTSLITITLVWARLAYEKSGPAAMTPTLFIVLGPLGQSITAACLLGKAAPHAIAAPYARGFDALGVVYGAPVLGFALLWLVIATALVVRAARQGLPFSLTWWSFTFPVGTLVTGTATLAAATDLDALKVLSVALFIALLAAWATAAARTLHGTLRTGTLLKAPAAA